MKSVSVEEKNLYSTSSSKNLRLEFDDGTVLENESIYYESMELDKTVCEKNSLQFGKCGVSIFKIKILNIPKSHVGSKLKVSLSVYGKEKTYTRVLGYFIVTNDEITDDKAYRDITAKDYMYKLFNEDVKDWYENLEFPLSVKQFRDSFFNRVGIQQVDAKLVNDGIALEKTLRASVLSGKDVIEAICEMNACFGYINDDNKFVYMTISTVGNALFPSNTLYPNSKLFPKDNIDARITGSLYKSGSLKYKDYKIKKPTLLQIKTLENDVGCTVGIEGNSYVIQDNFLLYGKGTDELNQIGENWLSNIRFEEFNDVSVQTRSMPWMDLGDHIRVVSNRDTLTFPILRRSYKGIQALYDTYEAHGKEKFPEDVKGLQSEVLKLKGKSNEIEISLEGNIFRVSQLEDNISDNYYTINETNSAIEQSANEIELSVNNLQRQIDGQVNTYYGLVVPTLDNYPANQWTDAETKALHNGDKYFMRNEDNQIIGAYRFLLGDDDLYSWNVISDTDATQALNTATTALLVAEETKSSLDITAKQIQATVGASKTEWVTTYNITYNGYGSPDKNAVIGKDDNPVGKYYMNQVNGEIFQCTRYTDGVSSWNKVANGKTLAQDMDSKITQSASSIQANVAKSIIEWDTTGYVVSYANYGNPSAFYSPSETYDGKYYLNQQNGFLYVCDNSSGLYEWNLEKETKSVTSNLSSQLSVTAQGIASKVDSGSIISTINQSAESVSINASKINFNGAVTANNNFKINTDGSIEAKNAKISGEITSNSAKITGGSINITTSDKEYSAIKIKFGNDLYELGSFGAKFETEVFSTRIIGAGMTSSIGNFEGSYGPTAVTYSEGVSTKASYSSAGIDLRSSNSNTTQTKITTSNIKIGTTYYSEMTALGIETTGYLKGASLSVTGNVSCGTLSVTTFSPSSISTTGAISGASLSVTGKVSCDSLSVTTFSPTNVACTNVYASYMGYNSSYKTITFGSTGAVTIQAGGTQTLTLSSGTSGKVSIGASGTLAQIAFFGATGAKKQEVKKVTASSVTLSQLATRVNALLTALGNYGLINSTYTSNT